MCCFSPHLWLTFPMRRHIPIWVRGLQIMTAGFLIRLYGRTKKNCNDIAEEWDKDSIDKNKGIPFLESPVVIGRILKEFLNDMRNAVLIVG